MSSEVFAPASKPVVRPAANPHLPSMPIPEKSFRLCYVDDDENDIFFMKRAVAGVPGLTLTTFATGTAAVAHFDALTDVADAPDLVVSDLKMPCLNGCDLVRWIRQSQLHCLPVIILSSTSLRDDVLSCYKAGANAFATKPIDHASLVALMDITVRFWRQFAITPAASRPSGISLCNPESKLSYAA